jgi:hypothetical protein
VLGFLVLRCVDDCFVDFELDELFRETACLWWWWWSSNGGVGMPLPILKVACKFYSSNTFVRLSSPSHRWKS